MTDPSGATAAHAKITVSSPDNGSNWTAISNEPGQYHLSLPVGTYDLTVEADGFRRSKRTGIVLTVGLSLTVDVQLQLGDKQEAVNVTAAAPVIETSRTFTSAIITSRAVSELPVNGRNFLDFAVLSPGVVRDVRAGDLSVGGQRGSANTLLVDGANTDNQFFGQAMGRAGLRPYTFSIESVQEFQITPNGYTAEAGPASGGVVNVVTKSGTNNFHGAGFEFFRDKSLNAATFFENRAGRPKQAYHFNQFGGAAGGPLIKDQLFFFGSYDGQRNKSTQPVAPTVYPTGDALTQLATLLQPYVVSLNNDVYFAKLDWNIRSNQRLSLRYNASRFNGANYEGAALNSSIEHVGNSQVLTDQPVLHYTQVLRAGFVWDFQLAYKRDDEPNGSNAIGPETNIVNGISFGRRAFDPYYTNERSWQGTTSVSHIVGRHTLKAGVDLLFLRVHNFFSGTFSGSYTFPSYAAYLSHTPSSFTQAFSSSGTAPPLDYPNIKEAAAYIQDSWRPAPNLTVTAGVRYDRFAYRQPVSLNPNPDLAAAKLRTDRIPIDNLNIGPRMGAAWTPRGGESLVLRAGYGIYYGRTPSLLLNRALLQNGVDVFTYSLNSNLPVYPNIFAAAPPAGRGLPSIEVFDPNFKTQAAQQYSFQIEKKLGSGTSITAGYLGLHGTHMTRTRDINLLPSVLTQGQVVGGGPISFWRHPGTSGPLRPNPVFGRITVLESGGDSSYNGGFIQISRRFNRSLQLLGSYTFSKVIDDNPFALSGPGTPDYDSNLVQDTLSPNLDRGPGANDVRHRLVASGVWSLPYQQFTSHPIATALLKDWQLSAIAQFQSGLPFSAGTTGDPGNDGNSFNDRAPLIGRNTYRGPNLMTLDTRLSRSVPLRGERLTLLLLAEAFDALNRANFGSLQSNLYSYQAGVFTPSANFGSPASVYAPGIGSRVLQLGAKVRF